MEDYLIESTGEVWDAESIQLRQRYGARRSQSGFHDFLVRNVGFVVVSRSGTSITLRAAPGLTTYACFSTVSNLISRWSPVRVGLSWFDSDWHYEMLPGAVAARERLLGLMLQLDGQNSVSFRQEPSSLNDLAPGSTLANTFELWRERHGQIDINAHRGILEQATGGKFTVVRRDPKRHAIEFAYFGKDIDLYLNRNWKRTLTGCRVDEQPDLSFGRWLSDTYVETMVMGAPALSDIDATTTDIAAQRRVRKIYTRLVLPIETGQPGEHVLSASTIHDTRIVPITTP